MDNGARSLGGVNNLTRRQIENRMIVRFHSDANLFLLLTNHSNFPSANNLRSVNEQLKKPTQGRNEDSKFAAPECQSTGIDS